MCQACHSGGGGGGGPPFIKLSARLELQRHFGQRKISRVAIWPNFHPSYFGTLGLERLSFRGSADVIPEGIFKRILAVTPWRARLITTGLLCGVCAELDCTCRMLLHVLAYRSMLGATNTTRQLWAAPSPSTGCANTDISLDKLQGQGSIFGHEALIVGPNKGERATGVEQQTSGLRPGARPDAG